MIVQQKMAYSLGIFFVIKNISVFHANQVYVIKKSYIQILRYMPH